MLSVEPDIHIPEDELDFTFARSSGPGGQNVNKVNSKAMLRWPIAASPSLPAGVRARFMAQYGNRVTIEGDLILTSQRYRDQARNIEDCREKLREMLAAVARPPKRRRPTKPSKASKARRLDSKKQQAARKKGRRTVSGDD